MVLSHQEYDHNALQCNVKWVEKQENIADVNEIYSCSWIIKQFFINDIKCNIGIVAIVVGCGYCCAVHGPLGLCGLTGYCQLQGPFYSVSFCFRVATDIHCSCTTSPSSPVSYWRASRHWLHCLPPLPLRPPLCPCPGPGTQSLTPRTWPLCKARTWAASWHRGRGRAAQSPISGTISWRCCTRRRSWRQRAGCAARPRAPGSWEHPRYCNGPRTRKEASCSSAPLK